MVLWLWLSWQSGHFLGTPNVRSSDPGIGKFLDRTFVYCQLWYWTDKKLRKEAHLIRKLFLEFYKLCDVKNWSL